MCIVTSKKRLSKKRKRAYRRQVPRSAKERAKSDQRIRQELVDLRTEIDEDLKAHRIDIIDYEVCRAMIKRQLDLLDAPRKPGEIRVIGIPRKKVDWKLIKNLQQQAEDQSHRS